VFSLDLLKKYNVSQQRRDGHVYWASDSGPWLGYSPSLGLYPSPMNQGNSGYCAINSPSLTVPGDSQGLSELTGMKGRFTCAEFEVFQVAQI
jgi:hypothetical protein